MRRLVHGMGYRYRLHGKGLPGKPDLVFARRRKVIFVHGCFWHGHGCKRGDRIPKDEPRLLDEEDHTQTRSATKNTWPRCTRTDGRRW